MIISDQPHALPRTSRKPEIEPVLKIPHINDLLQPHLPAQPLALTERHPSENQSSTVSEDLSIKKHSLSLWLFPFLP